MPLPTNGNRVRCRGVNELDGRDYFSMYVYQIVTLYTLKKSRVKLTATRSEER